jgi:hypothetical protein
MLGAKAPTGRALAAIAQLALGTRHECGEAITARGIVRAALQRRHHQGE